MSVLPVLPVLSVLSVSECSSDSFYEYIIISDTNEATGINTDIGSDLFFKINRFYQNKCMEQQANIWKCRIHYNKLYLKKVYQNRVLEISDQNLYYVENMVPNTILFQKKKINFLKRIIHREYKEIPHLLDLQPNEISEINEICFQIDNINTKETYFIHLRIITNLHTKEKYYTVSYVTKSKEMFYMLLPFYLWESSANKK